MTNYKVALILAGCGAKDGTEITEAVSLLIALYAENFDVKIFAPNRNVHEVVDHTNNKICDLESRNMLTEAARIARGKIHPLDQLNSNEFDILCFAGGFGVAKNLCDFAYKGEQAKLENDISNILISFIKKNKIVAALCIAPILIGIAARELNISNAQITLGDATNDASKIAENWGIKVINKKVDEACVDPINKFVTAPAYMYDLATPADIFASATALVGGIKSIL